MEDNAPAPEAGSDNVLTQGFEPSAAPAPSEGQAPAAADATPSEWQSTYDEDSQGYIEKKGWTSQDQILKSYRELESMRGVPAENLFTIKADMEQEDFDKVYSALGRPEAPEAYTIEAGEHDLPELNDWFRNSAHKHGLSDTQARNVYSEFNEQMASISDRQNIELSQTHNAGLESLSKEWGGAFDTNVNMATRAADYLGLGQEFQEAVKNSGMAAPMLKAMAQVGSMMGEGQMHGANPQEAKAAMGAISAGEARAEIDKKQADPQFMARMASGDPKVRMAASAELDNYYKILADSKRRG